MNHLAISLIQGNHSERSGVVHRFLDYMVKENIPILSFYLLALEKSHPPESASQLLQVFGLLDRNFFHVHQIKISFIGKWYGLSEGVVDVMKQLMEETKEYDKFFVNFFVNYDGREEIVDAAKLIAMQVRTGKLEVDNVDLAVIKDNIYNSYFLPPDVVVYTESRKTNAFLLWDCFHTCVYFYLGDLGALNSSWLEEQF